VAARIAELERLRGIRAGQRECRAAGRDLAGVAMAGEIASSSPRIRSFGVGPNIGMDLDADSLAYARAECELIARALDLEPLDIQQVLD